MSDRSNKTIIMISHQLSVAATCDRVLVMDKGEIVQEGNHKDLVEVNGLYKHCLLYTSPSPRDRQKSRMPSSA